MDPLQTWLTPEAYQEHIRSIVNPERKETMLIRKFKKKPVRIKAVQLSEDNAREVAKWCGGHHIITRGETGMESRVTIPTLEGLMYADVYDWVIQGVKGEFYPCKPDIFEMTYETPWDDIQDPEDEPVIDRSLYEANHDEHLEWTENANAVRQQLSDHLARVFDHILAVNEENMPLNPALSHLEQAIDHLSRMHWELRKEGIKNNQTLALFDPNPQKNALDTIRGI